MSDRRRGYWDRRARENNLVAEKRRTHVNQALVARLNELPDGWRISDGGNLVTSRQGLRITVYQHETQGWSFIRSLARPGSRAYARHGFESQEEAMAASLQFG
jgi:hypothetical protein